MARRGGNGRLLCTREDGFRFRARCTSLEEQDYEISEKFYRRLSADSAKKYLQIMKPQNLRN